MKIFKYLVVVFCLVILGMLALGMYVQSRPALTPAEAADARLSFRGSQLVAPFRPGEKHQWFVGIIKDTYDVQAAKFVRDDYLQVIFAPIADEDEQGTCQAIANLWAHHRPQPLITVDCWEGENRIAQATVVNGRFISPPPPTGRRSSAGLAKRKAEREAKAQQAQIEANAAMDGKTMAEVEATHGPAQVRDPITGWAEWPKFKARFRDGKVFDVEIR